MLKRLISLSILAALSISAVTATAADQKHSSVASMLSSKKESHGMATHIQTTKLRGSRLLNSTGAK
jgi:glutamine cyclotransferase